MLANYILDTQRLLQNPVPTTGLYSDALIISAVNKARRQLAASSECIRKIGTISTVDLQREYEFSDVDIGDSDVTGIAGILNIRRINFVTGDGEKYITPRSWEWFDQYCLNDPVPLGDQNNPGSRWPRTWAQYSQGASLDAELSGSTGTFYLDPLPDGVYDLKCDCLCFPVQLTTTGDDEEPEALPALFTDAVPFFAAWYVLLGSQNQARMADAERYYKYFKEYENRARNGANPAVLRPQYEMADDPAQKGKAGAR